MYITAVVNVTSNPPSTCLTLQLGSIQCGKQPTFYHMSDITVGVYTANVTRVAEELCTKEQC